MRENLTESELVVFDLLTRPGPALSLAERDEVKRGVKRLLARLQTLLSVEWQATNQGRARVNSAIEGELDQGLPRSYTPEVFTAKAGAVFQHVHERLGSSGQSRRADCSGRVWGGGLWLLRALRERLWRLSSHIGPFGRELRLRGQLLGGSLVWCGSFWSRLLPLRLCLRTPRAADSCKRSASDHFDRADQLGCDRWLLQGECERRAGCHQEGERRDPRFILVQEGVSKSERPVQVDERAHRGHHQDELAVVLLRHDGSRTPATWESA